MLPKINRLQKKEDFQRLCRQGEFSSIGDIYLKKDINSLPHTRIGFLVEKKIFKKAVERNRIRRLLREVVYRNIKIIKPGMDIIIFYRDRKQEKNLAIVGSALERLLKKSNLLLNKK